MPGFCEANIASRLLAASPEYSLLTPGAPADSNPKRKTSSVRVDSFVTCRRMSCLHWQLPASCEQYHRMHDGLTTSGRIETINR